MEEVDKLKSAGKHEEAGATARLLGHDRRYGCHFGMRSNLHASIAAFYRGWDRQDAEMKMHFGR